MNSKKTVNKVCIIFLYLTFFMSGKVFEYISTFPSFIRFAESINFSNKTLCICVLAVFYLLEIVLCLSLFGKKSISYSTNGITKSSKQELLLIIGIILIFTCYSFVINHSSLSIGQKNLNSTFAISMWFLASVILAPISEELFFRGILIESFEKFYGYPKWKAILLQAFLFYMPHLINANFSFLIIYLGIITGILYYYSRSIVFPVIMHVFMNLTAFFAVANIFHDMWQINILYMVLLFVLFAFLVISLLRKYMYVQRIVVENKKNA